MPWCRRWDMRWASVAEHEQGLSTVAAGPFPAMKSLIVSIGWILAASLTMDAGEPSLVTVDLRVDETLKAVFDAGLRPRNVRGIAGTCEIGPANLRFLLSGSKSIAFQAVSASFQIDKHDRIIQIQSFTPALSLEDARLLSEQFHKEFGKPMEPCLAYLERVKSNWLWPGAEYSIGSETTPRVGIGFQLGGGGSEKPVRMAIGLSWPREWKSVDRRREPIKPPSGYENVSMEPLPNPNLKKLGTATTPKPPPVVQPPTSKASEAKPSPTPSEEPTSPTLWSMVAVLFVAAIGLLWLLLKKRK